MRHTPPNVWPTLPRVSLLATILVMSAACSEEAPSTAKTVSDNDPTSKSQAAQPKSDADQAPLQKLLKHTEPTDRKHFAMELVAQEHEKAIIAFWDRLRGTEDKLSVFESIKCDEIKLNTPDGQRVLDPAAQQAFIQAIRKEGYRVVQTEWHHAAFRELKIGGHESDVTFEVHATGPKQTRFIVKGVLKITWNPDDRNAYRSIDATAVRITQRAGPTTFAQWPLPKISPLYDAVPAATRRKIGRPTAPLLLYDLTGDGLSEIVLPNRNAVYVNLGEGKFEVRPLAERFPEHVYAALLADFTGDGVPDLLCAGAADAQVHGLAQAGTMGPKLALFPGDPGGKFTQPPLKLLDLQSPSALTAGDADGDGDLDIWVGQYKPAYVGGQMPTPFYDANDGEPSYLLLNGGNGSTFVDATESAGLAPKRHRRTYSCSFIDLDNDADLDLITVNDFAGIDIHINDGKGRFTDQTEKLAPPARLFGMGHTVGDYNGDGQLDLYLIGMSSTTARRLESMGLNHPQFPNRNKMRRVMGYGNRMLLAGKSEFHEPTFKDSVARTGWSWGTTTLDLENDGDQDLYVANGYESRETCADYCTFYWRHDLYKGSSKEDQQLALSFQLQQDIREKIGMSWNGFEKNNLLVNRGAQGFRNEAFLHGVAMVQDCRAVASDDLDGDGRVDLLVTDSPEPKRGMSQLYVWRNETPSPGRWIGLRFDERHGPVAGTKVLLVDANDKRQVKSIINGDSYLAQHALTVHFGLGDAEGVKHVDVYWPGASKPQRIEAPAVNRYHSVRRNKAP